MKANLVVYAVHEAKGRGTIISEELAYTLSGGGGIAGQGNPVIVYEGGEKMRYGIDNHPADSRVTMTEDVFQTLSSRMGTGGAMYR